MTQVEKEVRDQLAQALIARAEADEKIVQLRAMLQAIKVLDAQLDALVTEQVEKVREELKAMMKREPNDSFH